MSTELDAVLAAVKTIDSSVNAVRTDIKDFKDCFDDFKEKIANDKQEMSSKIAVLESKDAQKQQEIGKLQGKTEDLEKLVWRLMGGIGVIAVAVPIVLKFI